MINTLKVASAGYLKRTSKAVLIIAVAGYLNYGGTPSSGGGGGGMDYYKKEEVKDNRKQIQIDDSELIAIVELTLKTVII